MRNDNLWNNVKFHTFKDALDRVEEYSNNLESNIFITYEADGTFTFFGNGNTVATWICGDQEDDLKFHGIYRKPIPKKGYLSRGVIEDTQMATKRDDRWKWNRYRDGYFIPQRKRT